MVLYKELKPQRGTAVCKATHLIATKTGLLAADEKHFYNVMPPYAPFGHFTMKENDEESELHP